MKRFCALTLVMVLPSFGMHIAPSSGSDLAQRVARLRSVSSLLDTRYVGNDQFDEVQELLKDVRRRLVPHEQNLLVKGSSPRVVASIACLLERAGTVIADGKQYCEYLSQQSSLSPEDKKILLKSKVILFRQLMDSLFASIDRGGSYHGDEPFVASRALVPVDSKGSLLAVVEALECFAKANDDKDLLCDSCKNCPRDVWCSECLASVNTHSRVRPFIQQLSQETRQRVGVHDALWYLHSRIGKISRVVDEYAVANSADVWQGDARARSVADTRKALLSLALMHKDIVSRINSMKDDQLCVETVLPLLERGPGAIGFAENTVQKTRSYNPLLFVPAQLMCRILIGGDVTQKLDAATRDLPEGETLSALASVIQEGVKSTLGIGDKQLPLLCQLLRISSRPLNVLVAEGVACFRESAPDVEHFAELYTKSQRDQLLTADFSEQLSLCIPAWRTGGIVRPEITRFVPEIIRLDPDIQESHDSDEDEIIPTALEQVKVTRQQEVKAKKKKRVVRRRTDHP